MKYILPSIKKQKIYATIVVILLVIALIVYIIQWIEFTSYTQRAGISDPSSIQASYFSSFTNTTLDKYFLESIVFILAAIRIRPLSLSILWGLLGLWFAIASLQTFYLIVSFNTALAIGVSILLCAAAPYIIILNKS